VQGSDGAISIGATTPNNFSNYQCVTIGGSEASTGSLIDLEDSSGNIDGRLSGESGYLLLGADPSGATANSKISFQVDGTEMMKLESGGDVTIATGDIIFGTSGKGINLGVTSNTDSNTLDDYEEGEWSGVMGGLTNISTSAANIQANNDYSGGQAHYIKVGTLCYLQCYFFSQATSTQASGDMIITGLPFSAAGNGGCFSTQSYNLTLPVNDGQQVTIWGTAGAAQLNAQLNRNGATWASVSSAVMPNGSAIYCRIAGTYRTT
jgi:hypothetical protein